MKNFKRGVINGIPVGLGYLSVSFSFGIMAVSYGLSVWQATLISMLTVTSAGQLAGIGIMIHPGQYFQMLLSQITINLRYSFMSVSVAQKTEDKFNGIYRWLCGFMMTDEIFALSIAEDTVTVSYFAGLCVTPYIGWSLGTFLGALMGNILPERIMSALGLAIYAMFVAIVVPDMKKDNAIVFTVIVSIALSCMFKYVPLLNSISSGITISVTAIIAAILASVIFPIKEEEING